MRNSRGSHDITGTFTNVPTTVYAYTEFSRASFTRDTLRQSLTDHQPSTAG